MHSMFSSPKYSVGFTGNRHGIQPYQLQSLTRIFKKLFKSKSKNYEFHNGCCLGSDFESWHLVRNKFKRVNLIAHPPINKSLVFDYSDADEVRVELDYLKRNMQIVAESDILVATPDSATEKLRSGTWQCIRSARVAEIPIIIIYPNGSLKKENFKKD